MEGRLKNINAVEISALTKIGQRSSKQDVIKLSNFFVLFPVEVALMQIELPDSHEL